MLQPGLFLHVFLVLGQGATLAVRQTISQAVRFDLSAPVAGSYLRGTTEPRVRIAQAGDLWQRRHPVFLRREKANRDPATVRVPA